MDHNDKDKIRIKIYNNDHLYKAFKSLKLVVRNELEYIGIIEAMHICSQYDVSSFIGISFSDKQRIKMIHLYTMSYNKIIKKPPPHLKKLDVQLPILYLSETHEGGVTLLVGNKFQACILPFSITYYDLIKSSTLVISNFITNVSTGN